MLLGFGHLYRKVIRKDAAIIAPLITKCCSPEGINMSNITVHRLSDAVVPEPVTDFRFAALVLDCSAAIV